MTGPVPDSVVEEAKAEMARRDLLRFTRRLKPNYRPGAHQKLLAGVLECVEAGVVKRLIVQMPPRHGKSELVSRRFPAWWLGKHPEGQVIGCSYAQDLADDLSRDARNCLDHELWPFPDVKLASDSWAVRRWRTNHGGIYVSAGVGGPITGRGADILNVDDPVKSDAASISEVELEGIWNWWSGTARTRLMPGGAAIVTMTRWSYSDLVARLLTAAEGGAEQWVVLDMPALSDAPEGYWGGITLPDDLADKARVREGDRFRVDQVVQRLKGLA